MNYAPFDNSKINFVIYHYNCSDGTTSALTVWYYMNKILKNLTHNVVYFPASPESSPPNVKGKNVLICDLSYSESDTLKMIKDANSFLIIDHHITAQEKLRNIPEHYKIFDMNHCAAVLTWMYFFPGTEPPLLYKYVEDRDLWTKNMDNVDEFNSYFTTLPHTFDVYYEHMDNKLLMNKINEKGISYNEINKHNINKISKNSCVKFVKVKNKYYFVASVNSPIYKSDLGCALLTRYQFASFSMVYHIDNRDDSTIISLRSNNKSDDVSAIAVEFNGGGHRNASGLSIEYVTNALPGVVYDTHLYNILDKIYFDTVMDNNGYAFHIVYLQSDVCQYELGTFLLQDRYIKNKNRIQNCVYIGDQIQDTNINYRINCAFIWHVNGKKQIIKHIFDDNKTRTVFKRFKNLTSDNEKIIDIGNASLKHPYSNFFIK